MSGRILTQRDAMTKWCRDYSRLQIIKHWNWTIINVMQTAIETDKKQFDNTGRSIIEKLEPNISALGDNKIISRDHHLIMGIFTPSRFGIKNYEGFDTAKLGDLFRSIIIVKSNICMPNVKLALYFDGACSYYTEYPNHPNINSTLYENISTFNWIKPAIKS